MSSLLVSLIIFLLLYGRAALNAVFFISVISGGFWLYIRKRIGHRHDHGGFLSIDYYAQNSRLNQYSPLLKLLFALFCVFYCVGIYSASISLFFVVSFFMITVIIGKIPASYYVSLLFLPVMFILLGSLALLFETGHSPFGLLDLRLPWGTTYISLTPGSQERAFMVIARAFGAVSCLYFLSLSTPMNEIIGSLKRLKAPGIIIELMYLMYRYIFILLETQSHMQTAASARLGYNSYTASFKTFLNTGLNLIFFSFRRASDCFDAMESRCYDGEINFLENTPAAGAKDFAFIIIFTITLGILTFIVKRGA